MENNTKSTLLENINKIMPNVPNKEVLYENLFSIKSSCFFITFVFRAGSVFLLKRI